MLIPFKLGDVCNTNLQHVHHSTSEATCSTVEVLQLGQGIQLVANGTERFSLGLATYGHQFVNQVEPYTSPGLL